MTILEAVRALLVDGPKALQTIYKALPDLLEHSIRARIYENLGKHFKRVDKGIYVAVHDNAACVVIAADTWDAIKTLPNQSIDALITDPPYPWLEAHVELHTTTRPRMRWDFEKKDIDLALGYELYRVLKNGAHAFFFVPAETKVTRPSIDAFIKTLEKCGFVFNKRFIWDRILLGMGYNGRCRYEGILFMSKGERRMPCDASIPDVLTVRQQHHATRIHPTEKPVGLLEKLVLFATHVGDTVLDCFAGSCSTGVAALRLGRNSIMIEKGYA